MTGKDAQAGTSKHALSHAHDTRAAQDLEIRKQLLRGQQVVALPRSAETVSSFWTTFSLTYAEAYGHKPRNVTFRHNDQVLDEYPSATPGACVLFSGGVESTYISLIYPDVARFMIEAEADVHPRGGEMFIQARARGFSEALYGGNEKYWGERDDGRMWDRHSGTWVASEGFEFTRKFRGLWRQYLGLRIRCPTEYLYKDEIIQKIYEMNKEAYYSLQSCFFLNRGWCGYCDKCLITGAIIEALRLPRLFRMKASMYSEKVAQGLKTYRIGDYDPYWKLPVFRRLQDVYGYTLKL